MERNKKTPLLFALLSLLQICAIKCNNCPSLPVNSLTCYNDYNNNITCVWDGTYGSEWSTPCTVHAERVDDPKRLSYDRSCDLKPIDVSMPTVKKCSMIFSTEYIFTTYHVLAINVTCNGKQIVNISYSPICHIKVNPPGKPDINFTTVSWLSPATEYSEITQYKSELQWKPQNQQWTDLSPEQNLTIECENKCDRELEEGWLIKGEWYDARVRVHSIFEGISGAWSDWSPTTSWVSPIGNKPKPQSDEDFLHIIVAAVAVFALVMAIVVFKADKTSWVYIVKKIKGQPIPNPANSFLRDATFKTLTTPHFSTKSFHFFLEPMEIASEEVTFMVDAFAPCTPETKKMKNISNESTSSSFTNPSYSTVCTTQVEVQSLHHVGNLEPCAADSPYGPVGGQGEGTSKDRNTVTGKDMDIRKMFSKGSSDSVLVISDYEKAEKNQAERLRLQSLDSGICCGEEVSQDSMEADSINLGDEGPECEKGKDGGSGKKVDLQKLFGGRVGTFGVKSIQICSDYESVQKLQVDSPELPSLDSGVSSGGEEQVSQEEGMDDVDKSTESTRFLFPVHPPITSLSSPLPFVISGSGLGAALRPPPNQILERFSLMSACRSMEPSGDGYMPVRQEQI